MSYTLPAPYQYVRGTLILPYELREMSAELDIDGETLFAKPEQRVHMSIFPIKDWLNHWPEKSVEKAEDDLLKKASEILQNKPVTISRLRDEFRLAKRDGLKTVVMLCDTNNLEEFAAEMGRFLGTEVPTQPAHITIFTRMGGQGIGLWSHEELERLARPLSEEETRKVRTALGGA